MPAEKVAASAPMPRPGIPIAVAPLARQPCGECDEAARRSDVSRGLWLGLLGVAVFALTTPMTRLAVGSDAHPQLAPEFVTAGRAVLAAALSAVYLLVTRAPLPRAAHRGPLLVTAAGVALGFPLFLGLALRHVESMHAAVVTGVLPLGTAVVGALVLRQRASPGFWLCAVAGCALVIGFAASAEGGWRWADALLLAAVLSAAIGYVWGARLARDLGPEQVICWALVISVPLMLPVMLLYWPAHAVRWAAWAGFAYLGVFSMWLGFFAWYRALALGGTLRVSQVQLLQPFLSLLFAVLLLGERLTASTLVFSLAVVATVLIGKRMPAPDAAGRSA